MIGLLLSDAANLSSLGVDGFRSVLQMVIDDLLVGGIDQGSKKGNRNGKNSKAPVRDELDKVVRKKGSDQGLVITQELVTTKEQAILLVEESLQQPR